MKADQTKPQPGISERVGAGMPSERLRLADLLTALSLVTDLGMGKPPEEAVRSCLIAIGLARHVGLDEAEVADVYYTTLLKFIGCTAFAHEEAIVYGGDDVAMRAAGARRDFGRPREVFGFFFDLVPDAPIARRATVIASALARGSRMVHEMFTAHCEVAANIARRLDLTPGVQRSLGTVYEQWDGKGEPSHLAGEAIPRPARIAHLAGKAATFDTIGGPDAAIAVVRRMGGGALDPQLADAFSRHGRVILAEIATDDPLRMAVLLEPEPWSWIPVSRLDRVARAFADVVDLKSPFTRGHSLAVADLAATAASELAPVDPSVVRWAGLFHDLGRAGVPNGIWDKPAPLTASEWERVRLHAYHGERILASSSVLASLAPIVGMHHERLDGSGYHRQATTTTIPVGARLLAAADVYQAMTQERPHRPPHPPEVAAEQLAMEARQGRLDSEAVRAVLSTAGHHHVMHRRAWPAGLSDREVEVLCLLARGKSVREVAHHLCISPKTTDHHVQHIYTKIGVSTRAAAAMFAMEHELLSR